MPLRQFAIGTAIALIAIIGAQPASAQFGTSFPGFIQLPNENFTWIWGDPDERDLRRRPDFDTQGGEAGFRCQLTGRMRVSSRMDPSGIRNLEQSLATSLAFIQTSAETMTVLDQRLQLEWAQLACEKHEGEMSADEEQERLDRALEKAIRDRERRRAREQQD